VSVHPGTVTYVDADAATEKVVPVDEVPPAMRFARDSSGAEVAIVRVVARRRGDQERVIEEFGPAGQSLRRTVQRRS
jgi:hypothetical protein